MRLTHERLPAAQMEAAGGVVIFEGVVRAESRGRNVVRLEYEAYEPMAERRLAEIIDEIEREIAGAKVSIVHRLGVLVPGEVAVRIVAGAAHRAEAFDACRRAIEALKASVPIWKKEVYSDGEHWVGQGP